MTTTQDLLLKLEADLDAIHDAQADGQDWRLALANARAHCAELLSRGAPPEVKVLTNETAKEEIRGAATENITELSAMQRKIGAFADNALGPEHDQCDVVVKVPDLRHLLEQTNAVLQRTVTIAAAVRRLG